MEGLPDIPQASGKEKIGMKKIYTSIDSEEYRPDAPTDLILNGWMASADPTPLKIQILADGNPIPFRGERKARPDVIQSIEELADVSSDQVGFVLTIPGMDRLWETDSTFQVLAVRGVEQKILWEKNAAQIREEYGGRTLKYKLDTVRPWGGQIVLQGWILDIFEEEKISVIDEKKNPIPFELERLLRQDLSEAWNLKEDYDYGFKVSLAADQIPGNWIVLVIENHLTQKKCRISVRELYYRNSKRGRLAHAVSRPRMHQNKLYIQKYGVANFLRQLNREIDPYSSGQHGWLKRHSASRQELYRQRRYKFPYSPKISIVIPLYNTPLKYLKDALDSIQKQTYRNWELCLADGSDNDQVREFIRENYRKDPRIRYQKLKENKGISGNTNAAVAMAKGEFLMLCDHDDVVSPDACFEMVKALNTDRQVDIVYTDEDKVSMDGQSLYDPHFKPDFNLDLLRSNNYICHIFLVRKSLVDQVGHFRSEYDGAQDFDFILRCCEQARKIYHVPKSLYHWRAHPASTAGNPASKMYAYKAGEEAIRAHYQRLGIEAKVTMTDYYGRYRTTFPVKGNPKVSILIPNKDHKEDLQRAIASIYKKTTYSNFEIIILENNSVEEEIFAYYEQLQKEHDNLWVITWEKEFNYSAINNFGARRADGEYLLFLNNDIEIITPEWIEEMLGYCQREDVGVCGAKLLYPNNRIQHAGVVIGLGGPAGHVLRGARNGIFTYAGKADCTQDLSAVTAACMMTSKDVFEQAGGFDEELQIAYNDVDYCLKVRKLGKLVVYNAFVEAYHYESASRGAEDEDPEKEKRWKREIRLFNSKWPKILEKGDPYYNVNLTLDSPDCRLRGEEDTLPEIEDITDRK